MQPDGPVRDRQAQTRSPGLAVAGIVQSIKGLKYLWQRFVWYAGAGIKHANNNLFVMPFADCCRSSRTSTVVPSAVYRVAFLTDILHRASQQVGIGIHQKFVRVIGR